jgi:hypothetical protein
MEWLAEISKTDESLLGKVIIVDLSEREQRKHLKIFNLKLFCYFYFWTLTTLINEY